eukprot:TRINITY_DN19585_c0_g1_i4.p1 TRINITY_DN19585_c0_g1~~TRINITY_DN19585_c0_g1_i4.p1  ORF type:complete len:936 (+),score=105.55 TRINITY_DN19585_c0_g1_i4:171-2978(+)
MFDGLLERVTGTSSNALNPQNCPVPESIATVTQELRAAGIGSDICVVYGIDYTASNEFQGQCSFDSQSLHDLTAGMNPYLETMGAIGECLQPFTSRVLGFGFGDASTQDHSVFPIHDTPIGCSNYTDLIQSYKRVTPKVTLGGPTSWSPLIDTTIELVQNAADSMCRPQFHALCIIGDGQANDQQSTLDAIVRASGCCMSIFMVGVGDGPWTQIDSLDRELGCIARPFNNFCFTSHYLTKMTATVGCFGATLSRQLLCTVPESMAISMSLESIKEHPVRTVSPDNGLDFSTWQCRTCTFRTDSQQNFCDMCGDGRPPTSPEQECDQLQLSDLKHKNFELASDQISGPDPPGNFSDDPPEPELHEAIRQSQEQYLSELTRETPDEKAQREQAIRESKAQFKTEQAEREMDHQMIEVAKLLSQSHQLGSQSHLEASVHRVPTAMAVAQDAMTVPAAMTVARPVPPKLNLSLTQPSISEPDQSPLTQRERIDIMASSVRSGRRKEALSQLTLTPPLSSTEHQQPNSHHCAPPNPHPHPSCPPAVLPAPNQQVKRIAVPALKRTHPKIDFMTELQQKIGAKTLSCSTQGDLPSEEILPKRESEGIALEDAPPELEQLGDFGPWAAPRAVRGKGSKGKGPPARGRGGKRSDAGGPTRGIKRDANILAMYKNVFKGSRPQSAGPSNKTSAHSAAPSSCGDLLKELQQQSSFFKKVEAQAIKFGPQLQELSQIIHGYHAQGEEDLLAFMFELEKTLNQLEDEMAVLKRAVPDWPSDRVDVLREITKRYQNFSRISQVLKQYSNAEFGNKSSDVLAATEKLVNIFDSCSKELEAYGRKREDDQAKFHAAGLVFDWSRYQALKEQTVGLATRYCELALGEWDTFLDHSQDRSDRKSQILRRRGCNLLQGALGFGFRVYGFAGGFDEEATDIYSKVHEVYQQTGE